MKLIMTRGLPGSGKTTWAKDLIDKNPGQYKRINKDDLRLMIDNGKWSKNNEDYILGVRDAMATTALLNGYNVIIDDTNLPEKHELHLKALAAGVGAQFEIQDFTTVPLETCLDRDSKRQNRVGKKVIMDFYNKHLKPVPPTIVFDPNLPNAIICDIDGTLAHMNGRSPYDASTCENDKEDRIISDILDIYGNDPITSPEIILCSGREEKYRLQTEAWLLQHAIPHDNLFMRQTGDSRKDAIVKKEIYENEIKGKYNILFVLDDRDRVVDMWRSLGLKCLQVAEGDF